MAQFRYEVFDSAGARSSGELESVSIQQAREQLIKQGLLVKSIEEIGIKASGFSFSFERITLADIEFLTSELSVLLDAGLKVDQGIELLRSSSKKPMLTDMLDKISKQMRSGKQLSEALVAFPKYFDPLYVNLVSIGEATGRLADVFKELSKDLGFKRELQQKVMQALTYPTVILFVCVISVLFIFNYVVPNMASLFEGQSDLPIYTLILLNSAAWLQKYQLVVAATFLILVGALLVFRKHPLMEKMKQKLNTTIPVVKTAVVLVERIRFNSGLAMMLNAGVPVDRALQLASGNIRNMALRQEILIALAKIKRGDQLSTSLRQTRIFPDFFASLLKVGEESGQLSRIFNEIAQRSQREFSNWVTRVTSLLEPILIVVMGGIVGGVVVVMMLSITSVTDAGF
jgi:type II secretory pathway component PulF